jgi:hypothetical protein
LALAGRAVGKKYLPDHLPPRSLLADLIWAELANGCRRVDFPSKNKLGGLNCQIGPNGIPAAATFGRRPSRFGHSLQKCFQNCTYSNLHAKIKLIIAEILRRFVIKYNSVKLPSTNFSPAICQLNIIKSEVAAKNT